MKYRDLLFREAVFRVTKRILRENIYPFTYLSRSYIGHDILKYQDLLVGEAVYRVAKRILREVIYSLTSSSRSYTGHDILSFYSMYRICTATTFWIALLDK